MIGEVEKAMKEGKSKLTIQLKLNFLKPFFIILAIEIQIIYNYLSGKTTKPNKIYFC